MEDLPVERVTIKRTITTQREITRPPRSVRFGCAGLVFILVMVGATLVVLWLQLAVVVLLLDYPIDQWPKLLDQLFTPQTKDTLVWAIVFVLGSAIGLPIAAYFEAEEFLIWAKR